MTDNFKPTAASLAQFDQIRANLEECLDALIETHRDALADITRSPEVILAAAATFLAREISHTGLAELLAVAIDQLVRNHPREE